MVLFGAALMVPAWTGCVRRNLTIRTDPQEARVYLNDRMVGTSPVTVGFTWYGDYDVVLRKEGYETLKTNFRVQAPWYQLPPFDFVAETMVPGTIEDNHEASFTLTPAEPVDHEALVETAAAFREEAIFGSE